MFKKNQEQQTNERKTFKEFVKDNRGTLMFIGGTVVTIAAGVIFTKNYKDLAKQVTKTDAKGEMGLLLDNELWERVNVTENIINNSGIIDQAKATITRKRDNLVSKLIRFENIQQPDKNTDQKILEIKAGIAGFDKMLDQCDELEYLYKCRAIGENILED